MENPNKPFNQKETVKRIKNYYTKGYEKKSERKPDFYSYYDGKFICSICGHKYSLFHFTHKT